MPASLADDFLEDMQSLPSEQPPILLNEKFVVHSYDGGAQQGRGQYDVKHVLTPTLEPFHCSDRGCKFDLVLKCSEDFTLTHFYISGPGPRCTEPVRCGLIWICDDIPKGSLRELSAYDVSPDELSASNSQDSGARCSQLGEPCARFSTDAESRDVEVELSRWREGRYVIVRLLDTHFIDEQVNIDVGMIALVGFHGRRARHQVPLGPWMRRHVQQAWVHSRPLHRTFSSGGWVCDGREFTGGCRSGFADFHQTNVYTTRFHCSASGFDLCDGCAHDSSVGKVTAASVKVDLEALASPATYKLACSRIRNLWRRCWLESLPMYFRHGLFEVIISSVQSRLNSLGAAGHRTQEGFAGGGRHSRGLLSASGSPDSGRSPQDPQQAASLRALMQLVTELVQGILLGVQPGSEIQVNDLVWAVRGSEGSTGDRRWERCRVLRLPPSFASSASQHAGQAVEEEEDDEMDSGQSASCFLVSSRDWKGQRRVQAEHVWKVSKLTADEEVMSATTGLFHQVSLGFGCKPSEVARLLRRSADLAAANAEGQTALLGAARHGCSPEVLGLLLDAKACPDQSDRHGTTPLLQIRRAQLAAATASTGDARGRLGLCATLLRRHGATAPSGPEVEGQMGSDSGCPRRFLQDSLCSWLGPLLSLRSTSGPPPQEALEAVQLLLRSLPPRWTLGEALTPMSAFLQRAVSGSSGPTVALFGLRFARLLLSRQRSDAAEKEPELSNLVLRLGMLRWAQNLVDSGDPVQAGLCGPAPEARSISAEELVSEARALIDECQAADGEDSCHWWDETELWRRNESLAGVTAALDAVESCPASGPGDTAVRDAFCSMRDLLMQLSGQLGCTAFELETSRLPSRLLKLLRAEPNQASIAARGLVSPWHPTGVHSERWACFREVFGLVTEQPAHGFQRLLESLHDVVSTGESLPTWSRKKERGLKALTEPVQLKLQQVASNSQPAAGCQPLSEAVSVMVEPLVPLRDILRYLLRVSPVGSEHYLAFCHGLVGGTVKDRTSGERGQVVAFELLLSDQPLPVHSVRFESQGGEVQRLLLAMRDYEYLAPAAPLWSDEETAPSINFKVALSLLHLAGGSKRYRPLLEQLRGQLTTAQQCSAEDDDGLTERAEKRRRSMKRSRRGEHEVLWAAIVEAQEEDADDDPVSQEASDSEASTSEENTKGTRSAAAAQQRAAESQALQHAVQLADLCGTAHALKALDAERARMASATAAAERAAGEEGGQSAVDPSMRVHTVNVAVPEEIPFDVFWPMVQEDITGAVQDFYPRGMPPQVQQSLEAGIAKDGVLPIAMCLTLEEAEMLAARLAHLAQTAVSVDSAAVREERRRVSRAPPEVQGSRWTAQLAARLTAAAAAARAPSLAVRVRLRPSAEDDDWISGVVVGHGPPEAPWRQEGPAGASDVMVDVIDDQGLVWELLPPSRVRLPPGQKGGRGGAAGGFAERILTRPSSGASREQLLPTRPPPPPPLAPPSPETRPVQLWPQSPPRPPPQRAARAAAEDEMETPVLRPRPPEASESPEVELWDAWPGGVATPPEEPPTPVLQVKVEKQETEGRAAAAGDERRSRRDRGRRRRSPSSGSSRSSKSSRSRSRSRRARAGAAAARRRAGRESRESGRRRSGPAEGDAPTPVLPPVAQLVARDALDNSGGRSRSSEGRGQEAPSQPTPPRSRPVIRGALIDVLRGDLPAFARACDSQDPTTLLGHPVVERLCSDDLADEEEAAVDGKTAPRPCQGQPSLGVAAEGAGDGIWLPPPTFQIRFCSLPGSKEGPASLLSLPPDWNLLKAMQFLHDSGNSKERRCRASPDESDEEEAVEKVALENWQLGYTLEPTDARPLAAGLGLDEGLAGLDCFALPPAADFAESAATCSTASGSSLSKLSALSFSASSSPASSSWASAREGLPGRSPWLRPKRRKTTAPQESPSLVPRELYSPVFTPLASPAAAAAGAQENREPCDRQSLLRRCLGKGRAVADALELLSLLWAAAGDAKSLSWVSQKLDWKLTCQLEDPLSVSSGALPFWATALPRLCPFLFSLQTRKNLLRCTAFGPSFAVHWAQENKVGHHLRRRQSLPTELSTAAQSDPRKLEDLLQEVSNIEDHVVKSDFWLGALQSTLLRLRRSSGRASAICTDEAEAEGDELLRQAEAAMELVAASGRLLEVQFDSETGFGSAVTRSFYVEVARALQGRAVNQRVPLWVEDDGSGGGSSASGASHHLRCRGGLLVRPLPEGPQREASCGRFRFLGMLMGRALKDGFIVPLALPEAFFARSLLGDAALLSSRALPRPGSGVVGELCGALADFASELSSGEACQHRLRASSFEQRCAWRAAEADRPDFVERFLPPANGGGSVASGGPPALSFTQYMSLVGVSFLETGLSGAELCPGGADRPVTVDNIDEFVDLASQFWGDIGVSLQLEAFRQGVDEVLPAECFSAFSASELREMFCGEDRVEWGERELLDHLHPSGGLTAHSPPYQHLVAVLLDMDQGDRSRFLDFVSSCPRFPPGGIDEFHVDVFPDSTPDNGSSGRASRQGFPRSRACANQLYLPSYSSKEELRERLHEAMHGSAGHHEHEQRILVS